MLDNRTRIIIVIATLALLWLYYQSPFWITNLIVGSITGDIKRAYRRANGEIITFQTNHNDNDSDRATKLLTNSTNNSNDFELTGEEKNMTFPNYLFVDSSRIGNYSRTQSAIARVCRKLINNKLNRDHLDIGFIVNTRSMLPEEKKWKKGNFIRFAHTRIYKTDSLKELCSKFSKCIEEVKCDVKNNGRYGFSIAELLEVVFTINYMFNATKAYNIRRDNGEVLEIIPFKGYPSKDDIRYLFEESTKAHIFFGSIGDQRFIDRSTMDDDIFY